MMLVQIPRETAYSIPKPTKDKCDIEIRLVELQKGLHSLIR